jgi:hypothetical protein
MYSSENCAAVSVAASTRSISQCKFPRSSAASAGIDAAVDHPAASVSMAFAPHSPQLDLQYRRTTDDGGGAPPPVTSASAPAVVEGAVHAPALAAAAQLLIPVCASRLPEKSRHHSASPSKRAEPTWLLSLVLDPACSPPPPPPPLPPFQQAHPPVNACKVHEASPTESR